MSKRTTFTTITPLPPGVSRETAMATLHAHEEMIDLNPAHTGRHQIPPPPEATPEEYHCIWYKVTDDISYFPGYKGKISFNTCFHDLPNGLQTHVYAPMGLDIKEKWTIGGNEPHEPVQPVELGIGAPISGLYIREDVEMKCNFLLTRFVRKALKDALGTLVARLLVKTQLQEAADKNRRFTYNTNQSFSPSGSCSTPNSPPPPLSPPMSPPPMTHQHQHQHLAPPYMNAKQPMSPPLSPPVSGTFPPHQYNPADYAHAPVERPPHWTEQHSHVSFNHEQRPTYPLQYDEKPKYNEMDAGHGPPVELP